MIDLLREDYVLVSFWHGQFYASALDMDGLDLDDLVAEVSDSRSSYGLRAKTEATNMTGYDMNTVSFRCDNKIMRNLLIDVCIDSHFYMQEKGISATAPEIK